MKSSSPKSATAASPSNGTQSTEKSAIESIAPENIGKLDMVIAFDTTGSMAAYIEDVRQQVTDLIPRLFKNNEDLRLGIVAFGDYCDMRNAQDFGDAYQCIQPTNDANALINFVRESKDTFGGDSDEFYELVIKRIVEETPWRDDSTRSVLLIADAEPHPIGYSCENYIVNNQINWVREAGKAAAKGIKFDTVTICNQPWLKQLSEITDGLSVPFSSSGKTSILVEASISARGSMKGRIHFDKMCEDFHDDAEASEILCSYKKARDSYDH